MTTASPLHTTPRWVVYAAYVAMALLTIAFLFAGGTKLAANEMHVTNFARWGYPSWFMYITGLIEVVSIVLMWIPRTRFFGAVGLVGTMIGAIVTHLTHNEAAMLPPVLVLLALSAFVAWTNRPRNLVA